MDVSLPTIDIVIAALNEELSIGKCLHSLKCQDYPAELVTIYVVIDGRTTDDTATIAASYGVNVVHADGTGIAFVRNLGFAQGTGELVGFLDAHCFPEAMWISAMVAPFEDPMVGGSQGMLESICESAVVQRFLSQSLFASERRMIEHTVEGRFSPYPWILGGCSVFRRVAIDETGPSTECPVDDADRSWKVFLEGYQLVPAPRARSVHHDRAAIGAYLKKHFYFGVGAAQLAYAYGYSGKRRRRDVSYPRTFEVMLIDAIYGSGYLIERLRQMKGVVSLPKYKRGSVQKRFRLTFPWTSKQVVQISPQVVFWRVGDDRVVCVHLRNGTRVELEGVANLIFRQLIAEHNRSETCKSIVEHYGADAASVEADVDEFIDQLRQEVILTVSDADTAGGCAIKEGITVRCASV